MGIFRRKKKLTSIVYNNVSEAFMLENKYPNFENPNAEYIARQHECDLQFRQSNQYFPRHQLVELDSHGQSRGIPITSAVLVGYDEDKMSRARQQIIRTYGGNP